MDAWVRDVAGLALAWAVEVGPIAALLALLNRRDRRQADLLRGIAAQFASDAIRSDVAIAVRCGLVSRQAVVRVDMRGLPQEAIWDAAARLGERLPSSVRVLVEGRADRPRAARITVEARGAAALRHARA
jgi:hypothetical protein